MRLASTLQTVTFVLLIVALVAVVRLAGEGKQAHDSLCAFKVDLQQRVDNGRDYLIRHPNGLPALGISAADIQRSLGNQQATLDALAALSCPSPKPKGATS